jgi:hypothetical protein
LNEGKRFKMIELRCIKESSMKTAENEAGMKLKL